MASWGEDKGWEKDRVIVGEKCKRAHRHGLSVRPKEKHGKHVGRLRQPTDKWGEQRPTMGSGGRREGIDKKSTTGEGKKEDL